MEPNKETTTPSPQRTFFRVLIIGAIILILVFLSIGIVRIVPKVVSTLASATVSITSLFGGDSATTPATTTDSGFVIIDNKKPATTTSPATTPTKKPSTTYYPAPKTNAGTPDLAVTIVSSGIINSANGNYVGVFATSPGK